MLHFIARRVNLRYYIAFMFLLCSPFCLLSVEDCVEQIDSEYLSEEFMSQENASCAPVLNQPVAKKVLDNGLTVLVYESHTIPKVSIQMWYNVGSKDEETGEKGIAHLIEHMIFKGTDISAQENDDDTGSATKAQNKKDILVLSESDINTVVHKMSASCNAFTSFDYTGYLFNFPTQNWKEGLPIMATCMTNCTFKEDMLSSEMKAVIQELKMYRDSYDRSLMEEMIGMVFADHPYHYPIIGYKHDLWTVSGKNLLAFYKKHYSPNNATFVVVGDVNPEEVFGLAEQYFGSIPADNTYVKKDHFFNKDIAARSITIYRDVVQPTMACMFVVPGAKKKQDVVLEILEWIIGKGKSSRLYKKLVNETQLATDVTSGFWNLFDHGIFFILVEPKDATVFCQIEEIIAAELNDLIKNGVTDQEFARGHKKTQVSLYSMLESFEDLAYGIGQTFLATGDENYMFTAAEQPAEMLKAQANEILSRYFRPAIMNKGFVLSLPDSEKKEWGDIQKIADQEDSDILSARVRNTPIEQPVYAKTVKAHPPVDFNFPKSESFTLKNGLKVHCYNNPLTPKINIILEFKARSYFDPENNQGLYNFVTSMMTEGTENYTSEELAELIESRGMSIDVYAGGIAMKMLKEDFDLGLDILNDIVTKANFPEEEIEKVRDQIISEIKQYWDEPRSFATQVVRQQIYKGHPYSKQAIGTLEAIQSLTRDDLLDFYKRYISPAGARMAVVGDLNRYDLKDLLEEKLASWKAVDVAGIQFPKLEQSEPTVINYPMNRDQVVLCLAQLSIDRKHPDFDKYLLFDQIFGGGVLGSMSSRLFDLREETGLFYTIRGSLLAGVDEQPGMFLISTIVSLDRLEEAEKAIKNSIAHVVDTLTEEELEEAKRAVINSLVDHFAANSSIASTFLFLDRYGFTPDYFDKRAAQLNSVTLADLKSAVKKMLNPNNLVTVRIGRM